MLGGDRRPSLIQRPQERQAGYVTAILPILDGLGSGSKSVRELVPG